MSLLHEALARYGLKNADAAFLQHNENLTYRVDGRYLLRIHSPAQGIHAPSTAAQREAELAFLRHLGQRGMLVQQPVANSAGELVTILPDGTAATLMTWLPGETVPAKEFTQAHCFAAGEMTAQLHRAAVGFSHPSMRTYDASQLLESAQLLAGMAQRYHLGEEHADVLQRACHAVAECLAGSPDAPIAIHCDLSPSNILQTESGPVPIDFSLCGMGLPMTDLGMLVASCSSTVQRCAAVQGYQAAGGTLRHREMEAGYIQGLLGALVFHADTWPREPWFPDKLLRWEESMLLPFIRGENVFDPEMNFIAL